MPHRPVCIRPMSSRHVCAWCSYAADNPTVGTCADRERCGSMCTYNVQGEQTKHNHRHRRRHRYRMHRNDRQHRRIVGAATAQYRPVSVWVTSATYSSLLMMCRRCTVDRNTVGTAVDDGTVDIHTHIHRLNPNDRVHSSHMYTTQHA